MNPWADFPADAPYVLPQDLAAYPNLLAPELGLRFNALPVPYIGNPATASVLLLSLNPGYPDEENMRIELASEYVNQNRLALTFSSKTPFFPLDIRLAGTPGYGWWFRRLRTLIEEFQLERVAREVACVEWFPYHSHTFRQLRVQRAKGFNLPSQADGFSQVRQAIFRGATIVVTRSRRLWFDAVPELERTKIIQLLVPRSPYVTKGNMVAGDFDLIRQRLLVGG